MIKLKQGQITELSMITIQNISDNFLYYNEYLNNISLTNVQSIGDGFLYYNSVLIKLSLPKVQSIGRWFLLYNIPMNIRLDQIIQENKRNHYDQTK